jgi:hypothetical protein
MDHLTADAIHEGTLRTLPLDIGGSRPVALHLVLVHPEAAGPAAHAAIELFQRHRLYVRSASQDDPTAT